VSVLIQQLSKEERNAPITPRMNLILMPASIFWDDEVEGVSAWLFAPGPVKVGVPGSLVGVMAIFMGQLLLDGWKWW